MAPGLREGLFDRKTAELRKYLCIRFQSKWRDGRKAFLEHVPRDTWRQAISDIMVIAGAEPASSPMPPARTPPEASRLDRFVAVALRLTPRFWNVVF
jgi:hypothetical protein